MAFRKPPGTPASVNKPQSFGGSQFLTPLPFKVKKLKKVDSDIRKFAAAAAAKVEEFIESDFEVPLPPRFILASQSSFYKGESSEDIVPGSEESDNLGHSLTQRILVAGGAPNRARASKFTKTTQQIAKMSAATPRAAHAVSSSSDSDSDTDLDMESLLKVAKQQKPKAAAKKKPEKKKVTAAPNGEPSMSTPMKTIPKGLAPSRPDTYSSSSDDDDDVSGAKPYTGPTAPVSPSVSQTVSEAAAGGKSKAPPKSPTSPRKKVPPAFKTPSTTAASSKTSKTQVPARALELLRTPGAADVWLVHSVPGMDVETLPSEALKKRRRSQKPLGPFTAQHGGQYQIRQHQSTPMDTRLFVLGEDGQVVPGPEIKGEMFLMPFFERHASKKPVTKKAVADVPQKPQRPLPENLKMRNVPFGAGDGPSVTGQQKKKKKTKEVREPAVEEEMEVTDTVGGEKEDKKRVKKRKEEVHEEEVSEKKKKKKRKSEPMQEEVQVEEETEVKEKKKKKKKKKSMPDD